MSQPDPAQAAAGDFAPTASRPGSLWPDTASTAASALTGFGATRFDPLAEERTRIEALAAAAFDVCHPALALRAVLLVQSALALVALAGADSPAHWLARQAALAFGGVAAALAWPIVAVMRRRA